MVEQKKKILQKCPYCEGIITNFSELFLKKKYKCRNCGGKYFVIKEKGAYSGF